MSFSEIIGKISRVLRRTFRACLKKGSVMNANGREKTPSNPVWLYRTGDQTVSHPSRVPGINISSDWAEILEAVSKEQSHRDNLKVLVYPCAFLQVPKD
jgi:hypothetical protein